MLRCTRSDTNWIPPLKKCFSCWSYPLFSSLLLFYLLFAGQCQPWRSNMLGVLIGEDHLIWKLQLLWWVYQRSQIDGEIQSIQTMTKNNNNTDASLLVVYFIYSLVFFYSFGLYCRYQWRKYISGKRLMMIQSHSTTRHKI